MCVPQEGDNYNIKWQAGSGVPGLQDIYFNLMPRLFAISKGVPFMIQGSGQAALVNWGDGFVTDSAAIKTYGLSDPNDFFTALMKTDFLNQVCLAMPHPYLPFFVTPPPPIPDPPPFTPGLYIPSHT